MRKIFDIDSVVKRFLLTTKRYPLTVLVAVVGTLSLLYAVENKISEHEWIFNIVMYCMLMLPISISLHNCLELFTADRRKKNFAILGFSVIILLTAFDVIYYMHGNPKEYRLGMWWVSAHLMAAIFPFYQYAHLNAFWEFNKSIFINFLTAALYSFVLFLGLAGALGSLESLFNIQIDNDVYAKLYIVIAGIFNTYIFLGNSPNPLKILFEPKTYPKGLRIFTQYILLSLVIIYLIILYAYIGKIVLTHTLPNGWVSTLIIAYSISSILSFLLLYPLRNHESYDWIFWFNKLFYFLLIPIFIMAFVAIGRRISDYGFTEDRYLVLLTAIWLAGITLYFIFSKKKNIIVIPMSLWVITALLSFGPWGIYQISENNQLQRLKSPLSKENFLVNNKIRPLSSQEVAKLDSADRIMISGSLEYLAQADRRKKLQENLTISIDSVEVFKALNIPYTSSINYITNANIYQDFIYQDAETFFEIEDSLHHRIYKFSASGYNGEQSPIYFNDVSLKIKNSAISIPLAPIFERFKSEVKKRQLDGNVIFLSDSNNKFNYALANDTIVLYITDMQWKIEDGYKLERITGYLLLP